MGVQLMEKPNADQVPAIDHLITRLKRLREKHHLTQERFAELANISYKYYQLIESGRKRELRLSTLERLAEAYGIQVHQLLSPRMPKTRHPKKYSLKLRNLSKKSDLAQL
jgi:transcriptional regulator with XRE-family HTH domain